MTEKTDQELFPIAFKICKQLDGLPLNQALYVLQDMAPSFLKCGHVTDTKNPRFMEYEKELVPHQAANS